MGVSVEPSVTNKLWVINLCVITECSPNLSEPPSKYGKKKCGYLYQNMETVAHWTTGKPTVCVRKCVLVVFLPRADYGNKTIMGFGKWREDTVAES